MNEVILLFIYVLLALGFSFICSVAESVLLSITPSYVEAQKSSHPKRYALLRRIRQENLDQSLAAILTLNTIAHTVGAIAAGAKAAVVFGSAWFGVFSGVMTLAVLFFSEIVPKTWGAAHWQKLVVPIGQFIKVLVVLLYPIVWVSEKLTQILARGKDVHIFSREEFIAMAQVGVEVGEIQDTESSFIRNILAFDSVRVDDIKTPRSVMTVLPVDMTVQEAMERVVQTPFSRLPVYEGSVDKVVGFVLKEDVLLAMAQKRGQETLSVLKREILVIADTSLLLALLERFLKKRQLIAVVVNEYGETDGLVTLEDLIETLIGKEIMDETDDVEDMRALAREKWQVRREEVDRITK